MTEVVVAPTLGEHAAAWDAFVTLAPRPSPFLCSWWLESVAGSRPRMVLVFDGGALIGGIALQEDRRVGVRRLRFVGTPFGADHLDLVAATGREVEVRDAIAAWFARAGARLIELVGAADDARVASALPPPVQREVHDLAPWGTLPASFEEYWAARPSSLRNTVRRAERRLEREHVQYERMTPDQAEIATADFVRLHGERWSDRSELRDRLGDFASAVSVGLHSGALVAHRMAHAGAAVAIELWFELGGTISFCQSGRDLDPRWRGAGTVLKARVVQDACERGFHELDFLRGEDPYKRDWVDRDRPLLSLSATHGSVARLARLGRSAVRRARRVARVARGSRP